MNTFERYTVTFADGKAEVVWAHSEDEAVDKANYRRVSANHSLLRTGVPPVLMVSRKVG